MKKALLLLTAAAVLASASVANAAPPPRPDLPEVAIEIYRIAPGQHQAFLKLIAQFDAANAEAGLPPRQLYVHEDGADWDFIFIQPEHNPPEKSALVSKALRRINAPSDADFFFAIRQFIASHSDTVALGPTSAAEYLARATPTDAK
jgi:hypothetical protein